MAQVLFVPFPPLLGAIRSSSLTMRKRLGFGSTLGFGLVALHQDNYLRTKDPACGKALGGEFACNPSEGGLVSAKLRNAVLADIGLGEPPDSTGALEVWEWADLSALVPMPSIEDSKYTRGRVLVVGGSPGMTGAAALAADGALRMGAGYVTVAVPEPSLRVMECILRAPVKVALAVDPDGGLGAAALERLLELARKADSVVIGPGLGRAASTVATVRSFLRESAVPAVVDADALFALGCSAIEGRPTPTVLTPHSGEAARKRRGLGRLEGQRFGQSASELEAGG